MAGKMAGRGALVVLEGCDRVGKSTQARLLVDNLNKSGRQAHLLNFPDRSSVIGGVLDEYLRLGKDLDDHAVHLLFSANRWEAAAGMERRLAAGESLVVDRYAYSGAAFTAAKGLPLAWCRACDVGLPRPDLVLFLELSAEQSKQRTGFGEERYEKEHFQSLVHSAFDKLREDDWKVVSADGKSIEDLQAELLALVMQTVDAVPGTLLARLWQ